MLSSATLWMIVAVVFGATWLLTAVLRRLRLGRLDVPNERSSHLTPTPTAGLSIVLACLAAWWVALMDVDSGIIWALVGGGGVIAMLGYVDDQHVLPPVVRLSVHLLCSGAVVLLIGTPPLEFLGFLPAWVLSAATVLAVAWCLNLFNFMDGIDAIAVVETLTVCAGALLIMSLSDAAHEAMPVLLVLFASCLGFLIWNKPPAKVFMGDAASSFTGFSIGLLAIWTSVDGVMTVWSWLLLPAVFFTDATLTLMRRIIRRERLQEAHCGHGYQCSTRALQNLWQGLYPAELARARAHRYVSVSVGLINLFWLTPLAVVAHYFPELGPWLVALAVTPLIIWVLVVQRVAPYKPQQPIVMKG